MLHNAFKVRTGWTWSMCPPHLICQSCFLLTTYLPKFQLSSSPIPASDHIATGAKAKYQMAMHREDHALIIGQIVHLDTDCISMPNLNGAKTIFYVPPDIHTYILAILNCWLEILGPKMASLWQLYNQTYGLLHYLVHSKRKKINVRNMSVPTLSTSVLSVPCFSIACPCLIFKVQSALICKIILF